MVLPDNVLAQNTPILLQWDGDPDPAQIDDFLRKQEARRSRAHTQGAGLGTLPSDYPSPSLNTAPTNIMSGALPLLAVAPSTMNKDPDAITPISAAGQISISERRFHPKSRTLDSYQKNRPVFEPPTLNHRQALDKFNSLTAIN